MSPPAGSRKAVIAPLLDAARAASVTDNDLVGHGIAIDHKPAAAAMDVVPVFAMRPRGLARTYT